MSVGMHSVWILYEDLEEELRDLHGAVCFVSFSTMVLFWGEISVQAPIRVLPCHCGKSSIICRWGTSQEIRDVSCPGLIDNKPSQEGLRGFTFSPREYFPSVITPR